MADLDFGQAFNVELSPDFPKEAEFGQVIGFEEALWLVVRAREIGAARGLSVTVAVHDCAGHPVLVARGSDRWHGPYMAMGKARLAAAFRKPTAALLEGWKDRPLFALSLSGVLPGGVTLNPGGCPLRRGGEFVGAIGVGGGTPEEDGDVARLAAEAYAAQAPPGPGTPGPGTPGSGTAGGAR